MPKLNSKTTLILSSATALAIFGLSYYAFQDYKPKALQEVREVRGYTTNEREGFDLPYPRYAKGLASDETLNTKKFTFQTDKTPQEIQDFYSTILLGDDWKLKKEGATDNFFTKEYKKDNLSVTVWSFFDTDIKLTFAIVESIQFDSN